MAGSSPAMELGWLLCAVCVFLLLTDPLLRSLLLAVAGALRTLVLRASGTPHE